MSRSRMLLLPLAIMLIGNAAWFYVRSGAAGVAMDLISGFPLAKERRPAPEAFVVTKATLNGQPRDAIFIANQAGTRIIWETPIPRAASLNVSLGLKEEAWQMEGDGVLFRIGVSVGSQFDLLLSVQLRPYSRPSDRAWIDATLDLSQYAGQTANIVFLTNSSASGADNRNGDLALWGEPRIVTGDRPARTTR